MTALARLQAWYSRQCNGEWEHSSGIAIESCDNPGWWVKISLMGTPLQTLAFTEIAEGVDARRFALGSRWLSCRIENGTWHGAGDETKLERILEVFLAWAEEHGS
ncbi:MAG: immunity 53 family protein [Pseudomonadota bacterium]